MDESILTSLTSDEVALLPDLLRHELGTGAELDGCQLLRRLDGYAVIACTLARQGGRVVVKLAGPSSPYEAAFDRTVAAVRLVRNRSAVPVPPVLAADVSCRRWPYRYLMTAWVGGCPWSAVRPLLDAEQLADAYRQVGQAVAELHAIQLPAFGELSADGPPLVGPAYLAALAGRASRRIRDPHHRELFLGELESRASLFTHVRQPALCHEDLNPGNIIFAEENGCPRLAAILDFDSAWAGSRETDVARLQFWRGTTAPAFWERYEALHAPTPGYLLRRPIYDLLWCLEYAQPTPQHIADTRLVCDELHLADVVFT